MRWYALIVLAGGLFPVPFLGQTVATPLITHIIDDANRVTLRGNVHPLAQARYDAGAPDVSMPAGRLELLLNRPADREAALAQYMQDVHARGAAAYHQWLTPDEFGRRFGPADSDIQQVSNWLSQMGFQVAGASKGRTLLEFSGTVGQVNTAFHTQIHRYAVNGRVHYANATDPQIPEGLAAIVRGVSSLNDFHPGTNLRVVGPGHVDPTTRKISPDDNLNSPLGLFHGVGPEDFAKQYDLAPLYAAGTNGSGKVIGIINDSNIDVNLANAYRGMFNLPANPAQVVLDGDDPGINGDAEEAYLDVEMAGAVAPGATVNLYIASWDVVANALNDPLILAARRAVEDNQADVLSVSFGECEAGIGLADNQILASLWEQAAAQGQTVFVSSGDSGSAGCDDPNTQQEAVDGLAVNGFASTPWNVAVGGTDFYYSDYATGGASATGLWNAVNDTNLGSLKAPLPEQVWNDAYGLNIVNPGNTNDYQYNIIGAGGGASGCLNPAASAPGSILPFVCNPVSGTLYGYAKPSWQSAPGVPADGVRDLPDVSLFAANGDNLSAYVICANPGDCVPGSAQPTPVTVVGGTSSAAPAMAGIMALIDQKYGRQGQANYTLYPLAQQKASVFHDVTVGGNNVPCQQGSTNCAFVTNSNSLLNYSLSGYSAKSGYDLASGLGSVDANALVTNWESLTFAATTTSLQLSSSSFPHGTPITATVNVGSSSGGATPQGGVSILTNSLLPASQSLDLLTLGSNGSASGSISSLPGGSYQIWANYGGDGLHTASHSSAVSLNVTPEASTLSISGWNTGFTAIQNPAAACTPVVGNNESPVPSGSSTSLGIPLWLTVQPAGVTSGTIAPATGTATFTLDGQPAPVALNVSGIATWAVPLLGAGSHTATASYSGDASLGPSTALPFTYTVTKYQPSLQISPGGACNSHDVCSLFVGDSLPVEVYLAGSPCILPTGSITVTLGSQTQTVALSPAGYPAGQTLTGVTTFSNLQAGTYPLSASYSGDSNHQARSYPPQLSIAVTPAAGPRIASTTVVSESDSVLTYNDGDVLFTVTVTGGTGASAPPTGIVYIAQNGEAQFETQLTPSGPNTATGQVFTQGLGSYSPIFNFGLNQITGIYTGDSTYQSSVSAPIPLTFVTSAVTADFTLAPQLNQVSVQPGNSGTVGITLAPFYGFSGAVTLSCAPSSGEIGCSINPGTVTVNGQATAMLTITVAAQAVGLAENRQEPVPWPMTAGMLGFCFFLVGVRTSRKLGRSILFSLCVVAAISASGCGSRGTTSTATTPPPLQTTSPTLIPYSVLVTGTSKAIVHTAKVTVTVP